MLFGEAADRDRASFERLDLTTVQAAGLAEAVAARRRHGADAGDAVLLSPACASFDEFTTTSSGARSFKWLVLDSLDR